MQPDAPYHPADHAAGFGRTASAWLLYAVMLLAGLGLPSLWAEAVEPATVPMTAKLPVAGPEQICQAPGRWPAPAVARDRMG